MRLGYSKSKKATSLYVYKSVSKNGKRSTKIIEKLGTTAEIEKKTGRDAYEWAKEYILELNKQAEEDSLSVLIPHSPAKELKYDEQTEFNGGYLFLQKIYYELGIDKICRSISRKHNFDFDLNAIVSRLVYSRILFPNSKLATLELSKKYIEQSKLELQHIYRALDYLSKESDYIQSALYQNTLKISKRKTGVIFYDCTNYFFEIEHEKGLKQYGASKEHRPNPIVQMGLFMDSEGIPLAFCINPGNTNEQSTLKPLEKKLVTDFDLSTFVVCTDAGLSSYDNRKYNSIQGRAFVTTQSIKILKKHLKEWALESTGWHLNGSKEVFDITKIDRKAMYDKTFYKDRWINENGLEQHLIITYSVKYDEYQKNIRAKQIIRAEKLLDSNAIEHISQTDCKRFIDKTSCTKDGEIADKKVYSLNQDIIDKESQYDGFYAVCTNLEDDPNIIVKINQRRWEIEECFRIMKTDFKTRPVFLSNDERIKAHFLTCMLSLVVYRYLEKKLDSEYTCSEILDCLKTFNFIEEKGFGYIPTYTRTNLTDKLHDACDFQTHYSIIPSKKMRNICSNTKIHK